MYPTKSHSEPAPTVSTIHAEDSTKLMRESSFATEVADTDGPIYARAVTLERTGQSRNENPVQTEGSVSISAEIMNRPKMPQYPGLERWILVERIGDGAFSNVYRAQDSTMEFADVAIKVLKLPRMDDNQRASILNEVQIMRNIDHPNIIKLIDFFESHQFCYIILELCPGGELFHQIVRLTYFSEDLSKHVVTQVAKAIEYLHETSGVVHRDIKPENILFYPSPFIPSKHPKSQHPGDEGKEDEGEFTSNIGSGGIGEIKIADFGLSKIIWDTRTTTPCGTVGYNAPEIGKDEHYSKGVDMWALGCVLYTLLCGYPPFYDESIQAFAEKVAHGQFVFLSPWWDHVSNSAQDLVSHLLTVDPEKRYTIKEFMEHPWIRKTDGESIVAAELRPLASLSDLMSQTRSQLPEVVFADQPQYHNPVNSDILNVPPTVAKQRAGICPPDAFNLREDFDAHCAVHRKYAKDRHQCNIDQENARCCPSAGSQFAFTEEHNNELGFRSRAEFSYQPPSKVDIEKFNCISDMKTQVRSPMLEPRSNAGQPRQMHYQLQQQCHGQHDTTTLTTVGSSRTCKSRQPFELSLDGATLLQKRKHSTQRQTVE